MPSRDNVMTGMPRGGTSGYMLRAPRDTPLPTGVDTPLDAGFIDQGFVSEDGVERTIAKAYETIRDMAGDRVLQVQTEHSVTIAFALMETLNGAVARTVYGDDSVTVVDATAEHGSQVTIAYRGADVPNSMWVLDAGLGGRLKRYVFPDAQLATEESTQTLTAKEASVLPVTLALYPDADGVYFYEYSDNGVRRAS